MPPKDAHTATMRSRMDELLPLAEQNDGLVTAAQARVLGITGSVLARRVSGTPSPPDWARRAVDVIWAKGASGAH